MLRDARGDEQRSFVMGFTIPLPGGAPQATQVQLRAQKPSYKDAQGVGWSFDSSGKEARNAKCTQTCAKMHPEGSRCGAGMHRSPPVC